MKKIKLILFAATLIVAIGGCHNRTVQPEEIMPLHILAHSPTDSLSQEQVVLRFQLADFIAGHLQVVDNKLIFNTTREEFESIGLPRVYYDEIVEGLEQTNSTLRQMNIENFDLAGSLEQSKRSYYENRDTWFDIPVDPRK